MLKSFDLVLAQDGATRGRLEAFGARVGGRLNLKRVGEPLPCDAGELARLQATGRRAAGRAWRPAPTRRRKR